MKPYSVFAHFYDRIMEGVSYQSWLDYIEDILERMKVRPHRVLDLACGTGNLSLLMADRGYQVIGIDLSAEMLKEAEKKVADRQNIKFQQGDMRSFSLSTPVELVVSFYDAINYILREEELNRVFAAVNRALKPGGIFIFDVNSRERIRNIKEDLCLYEEDDYLCFWRDCLRQDPLIWQVDLTFLIKQEDGSYLRADERHLERAYAREVLERILREEGFRCHHVYRDYSLEEAEEGAHRLFFVAEKKEDKDGF